MKKILQISLLAVISVVFLSGAALALSTEYELINPDTLGAPVYEPGSDLGYYLWTDDSARSSWHLRWSGAGSDTFFSGNIALEGNEFGDFAEFSFENHPDTIADLSFNTDTWANYIAIANVGHDGLDFTIQNLTSPSFVGFDLFIGGSQEIGENIFIGADNTTVASLGSDGDFKIAAPVPEPATMLLMGIGLAGFAIVNRRRFRKNA